MSLIRPYMLRKNVVLQLRTALGRTPVEVTEEEAVAIKRRYGLP
ncbi:hypothetical protein [Nonomuraea sp. 10N515B]